ncbi:hypothetical protein O181_006862 [Austropuccinia psidii MF-1]|uniref:Uncharacterized protein n=1 Tax=Austropuccinia psidii MF-1 TaxID=1389203 RepID=A0A9Q3BLK9_9BASI|nr:hypothetical protein [Austropuccinia psidii MF-1]
MLIQLRSFRMVFHSSLWRSWLAFSICFCLLDLTRTSLRKLSKQIYPVACEDYGSLSHTLEGPLRESNGNRDGSNPPPVLENSVHSELREIGLSTTSHQDSEHYLHHRPDNINILSTAYKSSSDTKQSPDTSQQVTDQKPKFDLNVAPTDFEELYLDQSQPPNSQKHLSDNLKSNSDIESPSSSKTLDEEPLTSTNVFNDLNNLQELGRDSLVKASLHHGKRKRFSKATEKGDSEQTPLGQTRVGTAPQSLRDGHVSTIVDDVKEPPISLLMNNQDKGKNKLHIWGLGYPPCDAFVELMTRFYQRTFQKNPPKPELSQKQLQADWKDLSQIRSGKGIFRSTFRSEKIYEYTAFAKARGSQKLQDSHTGYAVEYNGNIIAGNSLFRNLGLTRLEARLLSGLDEKWREKDSKIIGTYEYYRIFKFIDYSNKAVLKNISNLNQFYHPPLFDQDKLRDTQVKAFWFLYEFWNNVDIFQIPINEEGALIRILLGKAKSRESPCQVYTAYSWKIIDYYFKTQLNLARPPPLKSALRIILFQEVLYHTNFRVTREILDCDFKLKLIKSTPFNEDKETKFMVFL